MYNSSLIDEYGKPLVPLDDDKLNGVKPLRIQDQIATDENGRRRFHGAFTGGFSAGYWNTVGSQEGWKPQNFKSSRNIKAAPLGQKPLDFMDEEDLEEFGNAPLSLQDRDEDPTIITVDEINLKRVLKLDESKIIAATAPEREAKKAEKEKRKAAEYNKRKLYVLQKYGCDTGSASNVWHSVAEEDISAAFEPAIVEEETEPLTLNDIVPTEDVTLKFGFGDYTPLSGDEPPSVAKTQSTAKVVSEADTKKQKKLPIRGHAFGVGALEEEDDDIYEREDMSRYDFSLEDRRKKKQRIVKMLVQDEATDSKVTEREQNIEKAETSISDEISKVPEKIDVVEKTIYQTYKDEVGKPNFLKPRPWAERKSRFAPASPEDQNFRKPQNSAIVTAEIHQVAEPTKSSVHEKQSHIPEKYQSYEQDKKQQLLALISSKSSSFVRAGEIINTSEDKLAIEKEAELQHTKDSNKKIEFPAAISSFKPFAYDEAKQQRYEQFVKANACSEKEIGEFLCTIQPKNMSEWDREMEKKEFIQSRKLYRPLDGIMGNRFVTETMPGTVAIIEPIATAAHKEEATKTVEKIVTIVRTTMSWKPSAQLCKRFNIAEPITDIGNDKKSRQMKKPQLSVFDYLEGSIHTKSNFVTPVIIPKHIPCPKEIIKNALEARNQNVETIPDARATTSSRPSRWNVQNSDKIPRSASQEKNLPAVVKEEKISANSQRLKFVPKADRRADKEPQATAEKRELFQAIFSDNDEDEDEEKLKPSSDIATDALKSKQQTMPINATLSATASTNLLRNMSPPRGIFAALFSATDNENKRKNSTDNEPPNKKQRQAEDECAEKPPENSYGPAIPINLAPKPTTDNVVSQPKDMLNQKPTEQRISYRGLEIIEKWVEKNVVNSSDSDASSSSSEREQSILRKKSSKKSKKAKKSKKKSKKKEKAKHKSTKHKKH